MRALIAERGAPRLSISLWLVTWLLLSVASAAVHRPETNNRSARLLAQGEAALQRGDTTAASRLVGEGYRLLPSPRGLFLLGSIAHRQGRLIAAQDLLRRYQQEADAPDREAAPTDGPLAEARRVLAEPRGPAGEVGVIGEPGALLLVDGEVAGVLPLSLPLLLPAGARELQVELRGARLKGKAEVTPARPLLVRFQVQPGVVVISEPELVVLWSSAPELPKGEEDRLARQAAQALVRAGLLPLRADQCAKDQSPQRSALREQSPQRSALLEQSPQGALELAACPDSAACLARLIPACGAGYLLGLRAAPAPGGVRLRAALYDDAVGPRQRHRRRDAGADAGRR